LINNHGILKIADFGLARTYEEPAPRRRKPAERPLRDYTHCVVTRWYRPPELLLGERRYGPWVDMWGVGCVFAEMMRTKPLIEGRSDMDQLIRIFRLCGSPTQETMPGYAELPGVIDDVKVNFTEHCERILEQKMYGFLTGIGVDALDHEYFSTQPLPSRPSELPTYEASHELTRRKREARARAPRATHQANENDHRDLDRRKRHLENDMPSSWGGGSGMTREDSRGYRDVPRGPRVDSWVASRDGRPGDRERDRQRLRSRSPAKENKMPEPEVVKYGRR